MKTTKKIRLSHRAETVLAIVVEATRKVSGEMGAEPFTDRGGYWYPRSITTYTCELSGEEVVIGGASDARIIRSLVEKGLVKIRRRGTYECYATEDGALYYDRVLRAKWSAGRSEGA